MKRVHRSILAMLLIAVLVLAGCSEKQENVAGKITPNEAPPATEPAAPVETEPAVEDTPLSMGRLEGGIYTNTYAGFGCNLDSNWVYYSSEELQDMPDDVKELVEGSEMGDTINAYQQIFDMQAENATDLTGVNVLYTKLSMQERLGYAVLSESEELDAALEQKDMLIDAYAQAGITIHSIEKVTVTFLGEERYALYTVGETQGVPYYMMQINDYDIGTYGVTITISSFLEDKTADVLNLFYKVD